MKLSIVLQVTAPDPDSSITQQATLASLAAQDFPAGQIELVVSQYGSTLAFRRELERLFPAARLVDAADDGYYRLKNAGMRQASGEIIAMADQDCLYDRGWASAIVSSIDAGADVAIGFSRLEGDSLFRRICTYFDLQQMLFRVRGEVRRFNSHNVAFRADVIRSYPYDERFDRTGACSELAERLHAARLRIAFNPRQYAVHAYRGANRHTWQQALCEGFDFVYTRQLNPRMPFAGLMRLSWVAPPFVVATFSWRTPTAFARPQAPRPASCGAPRLRPRQPPHAHDPDARHVLDHAQPPGRRRLRQKPLRLAR